MRLNVLDLVHAGEIEVGHADFLALIDKGGSPHGQKQSAEQLSGLLPELTFMTIAGYGAGLIVVLQVIGVPGHLPGPLSESPGQAFGPELALEPLDQKLICRHVLEVEDHIQFPPLRQGEIQGHLRSDENSLPHGEAVVMIQYLSAEGAQDFMAAFLGKVVLQARETNAPPAVLQTRLPEEVDHIAAKARHPLFQPEAENLLDLLQNLGVAVIEIRLVFGKKVQVVLAALFIVSPRRPAEETGPVVGRPAVLPGAPDVVVPVGAVLVPALLEPGMLV